MKRYSKSQLAKGYLALARERSPHHAREALAAAIMSLRLTHEVEAVVREISRELAQEGRILGEVISARQLSPELKKEIEGTLKRLTPTAHLSLTYQRDENLIGGFVAKLPTQEIDASLIAVIRKISYV